MHVTVSYFPERFSRSLVLKVVRSATPAAAARWAASVCMASLMSEAITVAPRVASGMAREPTPHPASQKVSPALAVPSWSTQPSTFSTVIPCPVRMSSCTLFTSPSSL
tara:strand:+ start:821 stop:1144 length:324 start_codon:yes stop_codon:yes gene_type:complete